MKRTFNAAVATSPTLSPNFIHTYDRDQLHSMRRAFGPIDFMIAYGAGPAKVATFPSDQLIAARQRWLDFPMAALDRVIQNRIDEEGCGPAFGVVREHWERGR